MAKHVMTAARKAALKKAQTASAAKRRGTSYATVHQKGTFQKAFDVHGHRTKRAATRYAKKHKALAVVKVRGTDAIKFGERYGRFGRVVRNMTLTK